MSYLIETEIGHDLDDFLAICWLLEQGKNIDGLLITPGGNDQLMLAELIREFSGQNFEIGTLNDSYTKSSVGGVHSKLLDKYKPPMPKDVLSAAELLNKYSRSDYLVLGPPKCLQENLHKVKNFSPASIVVQGGFCPYTLYRPKEVLKKFENKLSVPSFNVGGARDIVINVLAKGKSPTYFVGKNVCHSVIYTKEDFDDFPEPKNNAGKLIQETLSLHFSRKGGKAMHDLVAVVCGVYPEVGRWISGIPLYCGASNSWTTIACENTGVNVLIDMNYGKFWNRLGW